MIRMRQVNTKRHKRPYENTLSFIYLFFKFIYPKRKKSRPSSTHAKQKSKSMVSLKNMSQLLSAGWLKYHASLYNIRSGGIYHSILLVVFVLISYHLFSSLLDLIPRSSMRGVQIVLVPRFLLLRCVSDCLVGYSIHRLSYVYTLSPTNLSSAVCSTLSRPFRVVRSSSGGAGLEPGVLDHLLDSNSRLHVPV